MVKVGESAMIGNEGLNDGLELGGRAGVFYFPVLNTCPLESGCQRRSDRFSEHMRHEPIDVQLCRGVLKVPRET